MWARDGFTISTDRAHLDRDVIWRYLHDESTRDAQGLCAKFGWQPVEAGRFMRITRPYRIVA